MLVSPSPLLLLPDVVSGQAEGGANVMSDPDMLFAVWAQPIQEDTADNLLSALGSPISFREPSSSLLKVIWVGHPVLPRKVTRGNSPTLV